MIPKAVEIARAIGAEKIVSFPGLGHFDVRRRQSTHIQGCYDLGDLSVVNAHPKHWQRSNLFVLGGSTFPKNSSVTPTLTMLAQTIRAADTIMERYSKRPSALAQATHLRRPPKCGQGRIGKLNEFF
jgi:choline dehydrogenase-like flavoprotein